MEEKLSLLKELIKLARCDKQIREQEYDLMLTIAGTLNIGKTEFDKLFEENIAFNPPNSIFERILQFHRLVLLMNVDQETSPAEIDHLKDIGIRMGLNPYSTDLVFTEMEKYPNKVIPPEKLIEIFKDQFN